jgi:hypothetical protein
MSHGSQRFLKEVTLGDKERFRPKTTVPPYLSAGPLIEGESDQAFQELRNRLADAAQPADSVEDLLVEEIVNRSWQIDPWRRARAAFLNCHLRHAMEYALEPILARSTDQNSLAAGPDKSNDQFKEVGK